jgi:hypothetical protein
LGAAGSSMNSRVYGMGRGGWVTREDYLLASN